MKYLDRIGIDIEKERAEYKTVKRILFSSNRKRMSTIIEKEEGSYRMYIKGGYEIIVSSCTHIHSLIDVVYV